MTFKTPTLPELIGRAQADLSGAEGLRHSDAQVAARVQAGAHFGIYGHQSWIADQILPDTCEEEMLLRLAKLRPIRDRLPAESAKGAASFAGSVGAVLDAGTLLQRDDGVLIRVSSINTDSAAAFALQDRFITDLVAALAPPFRHRLTGF